MILRFDENASNMSSLTLFRRKQADHDPLTGRPTTLTVPPKKRSYRTCAIVGRIIVAPIPIASVGMSKTEVNQSSESTPRQLEPVIRSFYRTSPGHVRSAMPLFILRYRATSTR